MLLETISEQFSVALLQGDSLQGTFTQGLAQTTDPMPNVDGVYRVGSIDGILAQNNLEVVPFAQQGVGANFSLRVFGWRFLGRRNNWLWVPKLLVELACTTCDSPGAKGFAVSDAHNFCDTITLVQGDPTVIVNSTGPGTNLIASVKLNMWGAQKISFDFQSTDLPSNIGMNALWCFC